ncbi:DUF2798 domain-containing protein [Thalassomonas actiniarum]|uniref:DUF2798 domain-containing protein n=1 Tax=Thalassomonas actiniarum TaxID=485447 RepID=A0AAE9YPX4_9GAMM|nr:DUF2798 domain-containing protein [Thalassomonas actiniarum]WDD97397.1 DUF2798 domain-containing protein [Thalassomonas actiniarum]
MKQRMLSSVLMSFILSLLMTCWITLLNIGLVEQFASRWLQAFSLAWPAAALISFIFAPGVQKVTSKILSLSQGLLANQGK